MSTYRPALPLTVLSLNCWGGELFWKLVPFLKRQAASGVTVFCLQEVFSTPSGVKVVRPEFKRRSNLYEEIQRALPAFQGLFSPCCTQLEERGWTNFPLAWGTAIFAHRGLPLSDFKSSMAWGTPQQFDGEDLRTIPRTISHATFDDGERRVSIANFHGLWNGSGKSDSLERLEQSANVLCHLKEAAEDHLLIGDFNLTPETRSFEKLRQGRRDLIAEYGIESTRASFYGKEVKLADYALVGGSLNVDTFEVLPDEVSDHLALKLTIS